jgi:hypothetical protein
VSVGRIYSGVLGPLAMAVVLIRGLKYGQTAESTLWTASLGLAIFAGAGYVLGQIGGSIVDHSVRHSSEMERSSSGAKRARTQ